MKGLHFYFKLRTVLNQGDVVGNQHQYTFRKWLENGNLQFEVNAGQSKSIPAEIIIAAFYARGRQVGNNPPIEITDQWVQMLGQDNWCFDEVLNFLIDTYGNLP